MAVEKLTAGWIRQRFLATGKSNGTINEFFTRFKAAIRWAYKNDVIDDIRFIDKLDNLKDTPHAVKIQDKYLESEELSAILDTMQHQVWFDLTLFLALSGLRIGEAIALKRSDLDMVNREIIVDKTYDTTHDLITTPKTYASERRVYMQDELYDLCQELLDAKILSFSDILFNNFGERVSYNSYRAYLRRHSEKAIGRPITPHVLRHTHASLLMEQGMEMDAIAARQIYVHVTKKLEEKWNSQLKEVSILR
ncbi:MAG: site-specific integrase [Bacteroidales bacterium]|nr:site-specific integrase [Bacteroidales bacterium]